MNRKDEILELVNKYWLPKQDKLFIPGVSPIPASFPTINSEDIASVIDITLDGWFTEFKACAQFGKALEKYTGKKHAVLVNSGSSASLVAMSTMLEGRREKFVLTTALAFPTTVAPIYQNNKIPIYIDVDIETLSPNWEQARDMLDEHGDDIAGSIFTHTLGFPYDEQRFSVALKEKDKFLISDSCDSLGAKVGINGEHAGSFSDAMTLSFFPAHQVTCGEGGAILFDDDELYKKARSYVNWGRSCYCLPGQSNACGKRFTWENRGTLPEGYDHKYIFDRLGYNLKMTEWQAALGLSQINKIDEFVDIRQSNYIDLKFRIWQHIFLPSIKLSHTSPFGVPIMVHKDAPFSANEMIKFLESKKIYTRRFFAGNITRQPGYMNLPYIYKDLTNTDYIMNSGFWIGCHPGITRQMLDYMIEMINEFVEKYE